MPTCPECRSTYVTHEAGLWYCWMCHTRWRPRHEVTT